MITFYFTASGNSLAVILADIEARREKEMPAGIMTRAAAKMCEPLYRGISP